jgi:hypothetical protein
MDRIGVWVFLFLITCSTFAVSGPNPAAKVGVHVLPHSDRACRKNFPVITDCNDIVHTYGEIGNIDAFPVFFDLVAYQGFEYGLMWPAEWGSCGFVSCTDGRRIWTEPCGDPETFDPGDWVSQIFDVCQYDSVVVPGWAWFYASSSGRICIIGPPYNPDAPRVASCHLGLFDVVVCRFCAGVGGESGDNPCLSSTDNSTWGAIKAMFK